LTLEWIYAVMASPMAGSVSAGFSSTVLQPFDVIRTKQQIYRSPDAAYGGFWETSRRIRVEEGFVGFFRGLGPTIWRVIPGSAVYFFLLENLTASMKKNMTKEEKRLPVHLSLLSAAMARGVASILFLPITVVKTRFEAMGPTRPYTSTWNAIVSIQKHESLRSLWTGLIPTLLRDVPHSAIYFAMYNYTKSVVIPLRKPDSKIPTGFLNFGAGIISGLTATIISHPFDVIRTRLQTQYGNNKPLGMFELTSLIFKTEGWRTFTKGFAPRLLRRSLSPAFTWTFYEELIHLFKR
jgi:solute carrier family 25 protein 38